MVLVMAGLVGAWLLCYLALRPQVGKMMVLLVRLLLVPLSRPVEQETRAPILPP